MKGKLLYYAIGFVAVISIAACKQDFIGQAVPFSGKPKLPEKTYSYKLDLPAKFNNPFNSTNTGVVPQVFIDVVDPNNPNRRFANFGFGFNFNNPAITDAGATLGRVLFYDPQLSLNNTVSCGSCHKQNLAFSDGVAASVGFGGKTTPRNSMAILNAGFNNNLFWDSRVSSVKQLVTLPIQNHLEMGMEDLGKLTNKLYKVDYYPALFKAAFGNADITEERIASALTQFVCAISSGHSHFDEQEALNFSGFTPLEKMGKELFFSARTNCNRCHAGANFAAPDFIGGEYGGGGGGEDVRGSANTGLDLTTTDVGTFNGKFRIPSLRNIALTAPYMHDGRFKTLEEVIEHYNSGVKNHRDLDKNMRNPDGSPRRLNLNALEKEALIAFLNTLTDKKMIRDQRFSDPFSL